MSGPGNLGRAGYRRLKEVADGRLHSVSSWPRTFARLAEDVLVEISRNTLTGAEFARITRDGRLAIVAFEQAAKQRSKSSAPATEEPANDRR